VKEPIASIGGDMMKEKSTAENKGAMLSISSRQTEPYTASDLPIDDEGRIYHIHAKPGQIASNILIVGDPGRAEMIGSTFLKDLEFEGEHRGLVTVTGIAEITNQPATIISPIRTTVSTSGIGTPSLEIVINELVALHEVDFQTRTRKEDFPRMHVIRVGTSGGLQKATALGTSIITSYAIGMDNTGLYYEIPYPDEICERLETELKDFIRSSMREDSRFYGQIRHYVSKAEPAIVKSLFEAANFLGVPAKTGLTVSNCGFFAPQGRDTARVLPSIQDLDQIFSEFNPKVNGQQIENMEMEASFLLHFLGGLGHWGGAICPAIANRRDNTFDHHYLESIQNATEVALLALASIQ
jgi:uridine phosphorylase